MSLVAVQISRIKWGTHKKIRCHSLKYCSAEIPEEALGGLDFPNYQNFENINDAYSISLMLNHLLKCNMWKNNNHFLNNPSFLLKISDDAFQACLCLLSSHV